MSKIAIIRLAGQINLTQQVVKTLEMLNLPRKQSCSIVEDSPTVKGMIQKVKDCVTWGTIDDEGIKLLNAKRKGDNKAIFLHPPRGGYERKGTKKTFKVGGALGNREEKIIDLIKKMI
jgi:large subunit ribosomal protein L30